MSDYRVGVVVAAFAVIPLTVSWLAAVAKLGPPEFSFRQL